MATDKLEADIASITDPESAARVLKAFQTWVDGKTYASAERKRMSEKLAARIAQFEEAMQVGHSTTNDQILKLSIVETRWQDLEEARSEKKEVGKALTDAVKSAEQKIKDLLAEAKSGQMTLFADAPPTDEGEETIEH